MKYWIIQYWGEGLQPIKEQSYYGSEETANTYADEELARLGGSRRKIQPNEEANRATGIEQ